jgi:hypothetical protein
MELPSPRWFWILATMVPALAVWCSAAGDDCMWVVARILRVLMMLARTLSFAVYSLP